jgi:hypothetical protein
MNVGTERPPLLTQTHWEGPAIIWMKRLVLFFCFMLSGILLNTYLFWWSHQFVSVCDSGIVTPGGFILLFTSILLVRRLCQSSLDATNHIFQFVLPYGLRTVCPVSQSTLNLLMPIVTRMSGAA